MKWHLAVLAIPIILVAACSNSSPPTESSSDDQTAFLSDTDLTSWMFDCFVEAGFDVEFDPNAAFGPTISGTLKTQEEVELFQQTDARCEQKALNLSLARPLDYVKSAEEWQVAYDYRINARDCLLSAGYQVDDPPSFDVYVDESGNWSPHTSVIGRLSYEDTLEAFRTCPQ